MGKLHVAWLSAALIAGMATTTWAEEFTESFQFTGERLILVDLIGQVEISGHEGDEFLVEVHVQGEDASREIIQFDQKSGSTSELWIHFPIEDERDYVYPRLGRRSTTTFQSGRSDRDSFLGQLLDLAQGDRITVSGDGRGLEVWADVTIKVPRDRKTQVDLGVGHILATDLTSALSLDTRSGSVEVARVTGDLSVDTGSGDVSAEEITGRISIDTGSGDVDVRDLRGSTISVDTGSGGVHGSSLECEDLQVDTGSGSVDLASVGTDDASIDTGSGSVTLELIRMGDGQFSIDTGSGGIELVVPENASAMVHAETGSGGVRVDVEGADVRRQDRDEVAVRIGEGEADVLLSTGSGGIRIIQ